MRYTLEEITNATFANFVVRGDVTGLDISAAQVYEEIEILRSCTDMKEYLFVPRVGSSFALTRKLRASIWTSWENAQKHGQFSHSEHLKQFDDNVNGFDYIGAILTAQENNETLLGY